MTHKILHGTARKLPSAAIHLGASDPNEVIKSSIMLRRRPDGPRPPTFDDFRHLPGALYTRDQFAAKFGAHPNDRRDTKNFLAAQGFHVVHENTPARLIEIEGNLQQFSSAFGVTFTDHEHTDQFGTYRFRHHVEDIRIHPAIAHCVEYVSNLDTNVRAVRHGAPDPTLDPPNTKNLTPRQFQQVYNWPTTSAAGQVVGLVALDGYYGPDVTANAQRFGFSAPQITNISLDGGTNPYPPGPEATLDILCAGTFGNGCSIAFYMPASSTDFLAMFSRMVHPQQGDPACTILSLSFGFVSATYANSATYFGQIDQVFQDAATLGITVLASTGDYGVIGQDSIKNDTAHLMTGYPSTSPWVTAVGGTVVGNVNGTSFTEYVWNDNIGATGGGVESGTAIPSYQNSVSLPTNLNTGQKGRSVPDIACNASPWSACIGQYTVVQNGQTGTATGGLGGTSASAPMMAGAVATINAALGRTAGFLNPMLYTLGSGSQYIRDINPGSGGPTSNGSTAGQYKYSDGTAIAAQTGYPLLNGYDCCTGLGVPVFNNILNYLKTSPAPPQAPPPAPPPPPATQYYFSVAAKNIYGDVGPYPTAVGPYQEGQVSAPIT